MEYVITIIIWGLLISLYINTVNLINKRKINEIKKLLEQEGYVTESNSKSYKFNLKINNNVYLIKVIRNKNGKELSFNSLIHWQIKPSKKIELIDTNGFELLEGIKVIIPLYEPSKIVKYINENEIVFVKPLEKCFDYYIIQKDEINLIKEIKKEA